MEIDFVDAYDIMVVSSERPLTDQEQKLASFDIKLFGAIEITRDGQLLTDFRSQKALAILAHLISEGRPITREYLAGLAWPEVEQSRALGLLRRSLHNLSSQLPDCLEVNRRTVFFKPDAPATIDTRHFVDLAAQAEITGWEAAADLYRAPFLQGVYLSDCPTFEHWLISEQQHWQDQADALLDRLIQALSDQGNYASALNYANRRLVLAPWREATHRQVMRLLLYNADRSAALAQYDRCVAILADELGVEPEPETQALYEQIQLADPYPPHNVPPQVTPFLGRQSELAELTRMIANPVQRLITLVGPGGIGKTRLAIALAERQLGRPTNQPDPDAPTYAYFTHGIYLVSLTAVETASGLVPKIADALKFHLTADSAQRSPKQQLLDYLRQKRLLLILDNFEQLLNDFEGAAATGLLLEIVQAAPEVKLLVTTRERLQISGEQVYPIQGLAYPDLEGSGAIDERDYPAMALFRQIAQHIRLDFRCTGETAIAVAQICAALQGMPLAIELAAATINILTPAEILTELTHSLDLLATTTRHIPARHRSIRAAFETSWQQLSPTEQTCFQQLSVFRGGFTREAAQAVASASRMVLAGLANKSFIHFHQERQRYDVHELMRQFGAAKLSETATEQAIACEQHSRYYAALLEQQGRYLKGSPHQIKALTIVAQEIDNAHMCWQWALDNGQLTTLRQAVEGLGHFFEIQVEASGR
jgi:predicted ATPase/DNA-binding SARP family transcriptional activator